MSKEVKATFPDQDETLQPSGSIAYWSKVHQIQESEGRHQHSRRCVPVSCGACLRNNAPEPTRDVVIRRRLGKEGTISFSDLWLIGTGECAGYCRSHRNKYFRKALLLPDGSQVFFSEWSDEGLPASCGQCETRQILDLHVVGVDLAARDWTCANCDHILGMVERPIKKEDSPSSVKVFWLDRKVAGTPHGRDAKDKVGFTCLGCDRRQYTFATYARSGQKWTGLCDACFHTVGAHNRITEDKKSLESDTWTRFSQEKDGSVPVEYELCGCIRFTMRGNAVQNWKTWPAVCLKCYRDPRGRLNKATTAKLLARHTSKLIEVVNAILSVWQDVRNPRRSFDEQIDEVKQWRLAAKLHIGDRKDHRAAADAVGEKLRRLEVGAMFPDARPSYRAFVVTVIKQSEEGDASEHIVSTLLGLLSLKKAA